MKQIEIPGQVFFYIYCFTLCLLGATFLILVEASQQIAENWTGTTEELSLALLAMTMTIGLVLYLAFITMQAIRGLSWKN